MGVHSAKLTHGKVSTLETVRKLKDLRTEIGQCYTSKKKYTFFLQMPSSLRVDYIKM